MAIRCEVAGEASACHTEAAIAGAQASWQVPQSLQLSLEPWSEAWPEPCDASPLA